MINLSEVEAEYVAYKIKLGHHLINHELKDIWTDIYITVHSQRTMPHDLPKAFNTIIGTELRLDTLII